MGAKVRLPSRAGSSSAAMAAVTSRTLLPVVVVSKTSVIVSLALLFLTNWRAPLAPLRSSNSLLTV